MQKEKRVVKAILIHGILPFLTATPIAYFLFLSTTSRNSNKKNHLVPVFNYSPEQMSFLLLHMNPLLDCVTTLLVVRQYWEALKLTFGLTKKETNRVQPMVGRNIDGGQIVPRPPPELPFIGRQLRL